MSSRQGLSRRKLRKRTFGGTLRRLSRRERRWRGFSALGLWQCLDLDRQAPPANPARSASNCRRHRPRHTLARRSSRNRCRTDQASRPPSRRAARSHSNRAAADPFVSASHSFPPVRLRYTRNFPSGGKCSESLLIGTTYTVSGSWACTSIGNPKSVGRFPLISCQDSPASSLRITSQCFCMNSTFGRDGCIAMRCTQWPTSASGSGSSYFDFKPALIGRQVLPPSSLRNAPAAEMAT